MSESTNTKYSLQSFDEEQSIFHLKSEEDSSLGFGVSINIKLKGKLEGIAKKVNTKSSTGDYIVCRFINPYLDAQGDIFILKQDEDEKSIGYIFPAAALIDDEENTETEFDEYRQAYKFYCIKNIVESKKWDEIANTQEISFSELIEANSAYLIIWKKLLKNPQTPIYSYFPSLAVYGYYHYPLNSKGQIRNLFNTESTNLELKNIISQRFHKYRINNNLRVKNSQIIIEESPLVKLLYNQLFSEGDNALYRFLILYQLIEFLVEREFKKGLEEIILKKNDFTNYKFIQKINELYTARTTIKKLFDKVNFNEKEEITSVFKAFLLSFINDYEKNHIGDCFYDIRNLLFHDYKTVLEKNPDGSLTSLIIQCELLVHYLIVELGLVKQINSPQLQIEF